MADETTTIEPAAQPEPAGNPEFSGTSLKNVFDRVFPATAGTEPDPDPAPAAPAPAADISLAPDTDPEPTLTGAELPPDDAFDDKPPVAPKEYDAPQKIKDDPKQYTNWKEVRADLDATKATLAKRESEMAELRKKAESPATDETVTARIAELEAVNKEMSDRIASVDLQGHPQFQDRFVRPRETLVASAGQIVKDAGLDPQSLEHAMSLHGSAKVEALDEIVEGIRSPTLRGQLASIVTQVNEIDRQRSLVLSNAKQNLSNLRSQQQQIERQEAQEQVKRISATLDGVEKFFGEEKKIAFFRPIEGNDGWNKNLADDKETAKELLLNTDDPAKFVSAVRLGVAAPRIYSALIATRTRLKAVEKELAEYKGSEPGLGSRSNGHNGHDAAPAEKDLTFAEAVARNSPLR